MVDAPGFDGVKPSREAATPLRFAGLVLDLDACMLAREFRRGGPSDARRVCLLRMFVSRPGRVLSRDALLDAFANGVLSRSTAASTCWSGSCAARSSPIQKNRASS